MSLSPSAIQQVMDAASVVHNNEEIHLIFDFYTFYSMQTWQAIFLEHH